DLKARELLWFGEMLGSEIDIPNRAELIKSMNFPQFNNDTLLIASDKWAIAAAVNNYYILNEHKDEDGYSDLSKVMTTAIKHYTGLTRDYVMYGILRDYLGKNVINYKANYELFQKNCGNRLIKIAVDNMVNAYVPTEEISIETTLTELLSKTKLFNKKGKLLSLNQILNDSLPNIIDCWASWCYPCKLQLPFMQTIEEKYKGRIHVIYLSFDFEELKWKNYLNKSKLNGEQFLLNNNTENIFSKYFKIQTIPRYILLSKSGATVLNDKMPLPGLEDQFEKILSQYGIFPKQ
uniref:TlpA family protein disulfide reductase n=1 Tax=Hydrotalea sp. TaxID=2881279 RepID=UPI00262D164D